MLLALSKPGRWEVAMAQAHLSSIGMEHPGTPSPFRLKASVVPYLAICGCSAHPTYGCKVAQLTIGMGHPGERCPRLLPILVMQISPILLPCLTRAFGQLAHGKTHLAVTHNQQVCFGMGTYGRRSLRPILNVTIGLPRSLPVVPTMSGLLVTQKPKE